MPFDILRSRDALASESSDVKTLKRGPFEEKDDEKGLARFNETETYMARCPIFVMSQLQ